MVCTSGNVYSRKRQIYFGCERGGDGKFLAVFDTTVVINRCFRHANQYILNPLVHSGVLLRSLSRRCAGSGVRAMASWRLISETAKQKWGMSLEKNFKARNISTRFLLCWWYCACASSATSSRAPPMPALVSSVAAFVVTKTVHAGHKQHPERGHVPRGYHLCPSAAGC